MDIGHVAFKIDYLCSNCCLHFSVDIHVAVDDVKDEFDFSAKCALFNFEVYSKTCNT